MSRRFNRRTFLRTAAGAAVALPLLEIDQARGQSQSGMPRLVIFQTGQGNLPSRWTPPSLPGDALQLSEMLQPLSAHQQKMMVLSGVSNRLPPLHTSNGHNAPGHTLMTANVVDTTGNGQFDPNLSVEQGHWCLGPSIDHYIAAQTGVQLPLNLAVGGSNPGENRMFYQVKDPNASGANPEAPLNNDPVDVFNTNLAGLPSGPAATRADRFRAERGNVLQGVSASFASLRKRLGRRDQQRVEAHLDALADLERDLNYVPPIECGEVTLDVPAGFSVPSWPDHLQYDVQADLMTTITANALACGARDIITIQDTGYHGPPFEFLNVGPVDGWHAQIHNDPALGLSYSVSDDNPTLQAGFLHYAAVFAGLLSKMDAIVEPNGSTVLDNSIVVWISEFGTGMTHSPNNLPIVIAGGGGRIAMNRHLARPNATTNDLFVSLLRAYDLTDATFGYTGDSSLNNGPIAGLVS